MEAQCIYNKKLGLNEKNDPETFKACVPLVTHKELKPYIQGIADGIFLEVSESHYNHLIKGIPIWEWKGIVVHLQQQAVQDKWRINCWNCNYQSLLKCTIQENNEDNTNPMFHQSLYCLFCVGSFFGMRCKLSLLRLLTEMSMLLEPLN